MPTLPNPKHELFCQERAKGKTQVEAYKIAGYAPDDGHASRLAGNGRIMSRVEELLGISIPSIKYDREEINKVYTYLLKEAKDANKIETAKAVADSIAKVNGLIVTRHETGKAGEFEALTDYELLELIAEPLGDSRAEGEEN